MKNINLIVNKYCFKIKFNCHDVKIVEYLVSVISCGVFEYNFYGGFLGANEWRLRKSSFAVFAQAYPKIF